MSNSTDNLVSISTVSSGKKCLFSAVMILFCLLLSEIVFTVAGFNFQPLTHPGSFGTHFEATNTDHYLQDPSRFWIPKPDSIMKADWVGKQGAAINAQGFRGPLPSDPKPPGTIRVLCLGDSGTFGWAMNDDQTYPAFLELQLNRWADHQQLNHLFEVINAGVNGYSTFQSVEQYKALESRLQPDIVTIAAGRNDYSPVPMTDASRPVIKPWQIHFMKIVSQLKTGQWLIWLSQRNAVASLMQASGSPEKQTIRVNDTEFQALWSDVAGHCKNHGRSLVYIHRGGRYDLIRDLLETSDITVVSLMRLRSIGQVWEFMEGGHPDAPVYRLIAEEIFIQMRQSGILDRFTSAQTSSHR